VSLTADDIRAAVAAALVNEWQAAGLIALAAVQAGISAGWAVAPALGARFAVAAGLAAALAPALPAFSGKGRLPPWETPA
jgi:hypothetical protein